MERQQYGLTSWLPTTNILVVIGRIYRYRYKCNYLKPKRVCSIFLAFLESKLNFEHFKENEPHSFSVSEIIDSERRGYSNALKILFLKTL